LRCLWGKPCGSSILLGRILISLDDVITRPSVAAGIRRG
jgi:hypothetical protein